MLCGVIEEIEQGIEADLQEFEVPGASWALIEGDQIIHLACAARIEVGRAADTPTGLFDQ
jgi:hypothetical protein